jgi:hypothetical protein
MRGKSTFDLCGGGRMGGMGGKSTFDFGGGGQISGMRGKSTLICAMAGKWVE